MNPAGFTLLELLLAVVISSVVVAGAVGVASSARLALLVEPAALDTVRRAREGVDALTAALAGAGGGDGTGDGVWSLASSVPVVAPLGATDGGPAGRFTAFRAIRIVPGGRARLAEDQPGVAGPLTLDRVGAACPRTTATCGFDIGDIAVVFDDRGRFDVFEVSAVFPAQGRLMPRAPLAHAYPAGASIAAARVDRFGLVRQPDGSQTLTRLTWAGSREPIVDGVVDLSVIVRGHAAAPGLRDAQEGPGLALYGLHPPAPDAVEAVPRFAEGAHCMVDRLDGVPVSRLSPFESDEFGLAVLTPAQLSDGPWCPYDGAPGAFDADLFRIRRVDLELRVEAEPMEVRGLVGTLFQRSGAAGADATRWVRDRTLRVSSVVGR